ncbi:hypothetical protein MNV49_005511 [Pseudohyphozyma bogoriensis]|nr:hypothetical protein MNV49_005511 [Pseudohyphozyma bogoriensis]
MSSTATPTLPAEILAKIFSDPILTMADLEKCEQAASRSRSFTSIIHTFGQHKLEMELRSHHLMVTYGTMDRYQNLKRTGRLDLVKQFEFALYGTRPSATSKAPPFLAGVSEFVPVMAAAQSLSTLSLEFTPVQSLWDTDLSAQLHRSLASRSATLTAFHLTDRTGFDFARHRMEFLNLLSNLRSLILDVTWDRTAMNQAYRYDPAPQTISAPTFKLLYLDLLSSLPAQDVFMLLTRFSASTLRHLSIPLLPRPPSEPNFVSSLSHLFELSTLTLFFSNHLSNKSPAEGDEDLDAHFELLSTLPRRSHNLRFRLVKTRNIKMERNFYFRHFTKRLIRELPATFTTLDLQAFVVKLSPKLIPSLAHSITRL